MVKKFSLNWLRGLAGFMMDADEWSYNSEEAMIQALLDLTDDKDLVGDALRSIRNAFDDNIELQSMDYTHDQYDDFEQVVENERSRAMAIITNLWNAAQR